MAQLSQTSWLSLRDDAAGWLALSYGLENEGAAVLARQLDLAFTPKPMRLKAYYWQGRELSQTSLVPIFMHLHTFRLRTSHGQRTITLNVIRENDRGESSEVGRWGVNPISGIKDLYKPLARTPVARKKFQEADF